MKGTLLMAAYFALALYASCAVPEFQVLSLGWRVVLCFVGGVCVGFIGRELNRG